MAEPLQLTADALNPALFDAGMEVMNFLNQVAMRYPQAISFAPGRPPESHFGLASTLPCIERFLREGDLGQLHRADQHGIDALGQYGRTNGIVGGLIARLLQRDEAIGVGAEDIVVTVGAQEAMCLCLRTLCGPGDVALTVDPAYIGISGAARLLGIDVVGVPCGDDGIDLDALATTVKALAARGRRARVLYICSDHANPTGLTLSTSVRRRLLQAAHDLDLLLLEDGAYNYFCYDGPPLPPLKSLDGGERVVHIGSFAKSVFPGLRVGFVVADQCIVSPDGRRSTLAQEMSKAKSLLTVNTSPLMQALVGGLLLAHDCSLREFVAPRVQAIRASRDAMLAALETNVPRHADGRPAIGWNRPSGGFFLTVTMPRPIGNDDLLACAERHGVTWTPMSYFHLGASGSCQIRLSFSYVTPDEARTGIGRLAQWMRSVVDE